MSDEKRLDFSDTHRGPMGEMLVKSLDGGYLLMMPDEVSARDERIRVGILQAKAKMREEKRPERFRKKQQQRKRR